MSGLHLPPGEPPAFEVTELLEHVRALRVELEDAERTHHMLTVAAADNDLDGLSDLAVIRLGLRYGVELYVAAERVARWRPIVAAAEERARSFGLLP